MPARLLPTLLALAALAAADQIQIHGSPVDGCFASLRECEETGTRLDLFGRPQWESCFQKCQRLGFDGGRCVGYRNMCRLLESDSRKRLQCSCQGASRLIPHMTPSSFPSLPQEARRGGGPPFLYTRRHRLDPSRFYQSFQRKGGSSGFSSSNMNVQVDIPISWDQLRAMLPK